MSVRLTARDQSAGIILSALQQPSIAADIKRFFDPVCTCDVVQWIKDQIDNNNQAVISKIRALIAPDNSTVPVVVQQPAYSGYATKFENKGIKDGEAYTYYTSTGTSLTTSVVVVNTPAGVLIRQYCSGKSLYEERTNGTGGVTTKLIQENSSSC